jgi:hypothetical protein
LYIERIEKHRIYLESQVERIHEVESQVRKHRENILAKHGMAGWEVEDFTLRTPE